MSTTPEKKPGRKPLPPGKGRTGRLSMRTYPDIEAKVRRVGAKAVEAAIRRIREPKRKLDVSDVPGTATGQDPGFFVDGDGNTRRVAAPGDGFTCEVVERGHKGVNVLDAEGFVVHEATYFATLADVQAAGVVVNLI
jgi:hypothetical protein